MAGCSNTRINSIVLFNEVANFTVVDDTICTSQVAVFQTTGINTANIASLFLGLWRWLILVLILHLPITLMLRRGYIQFL